MTGNRPFDRHIELIRAEYRESPGLRLKRTQIARLWRLDSPTCDAVLEELVGARFLRRTREGDFVRADAGDEVPLDVPNSPRPRPISRIE